MDIRKLQRAIVDGLEDVKGQHIAVFNTEHLSAMFERVIIASGTSNRQTKALAASVRDSVKKRGMEVMSTEGEDNGEWIIVDCGAAVAHIMQPAIREYYHLEEIWGGKSVRMKVGEVNTRLVKASEPERQPAGAATKKPARKTAAAAAAPAKRPAARKTASANAARQSTSAPAAKTPASRKAARSRTATPSAVASQRAVKKTPAKRGAAKTSARKSPARKATPRG